MWEDDPNGQGDMAPLEFIVRHQNTLKKLKLYNCAINVKGRLGQTHSWADAYKQLNNALTGLVELKVKFELDG